VATTAPAVTQNSTRSNAQGNSRELIATAQKNLPVGEGHGYRLEARDSGDTRGAYTYQNNVGTYTAEAASVGGETEFPVANEGEVYVTDLAPQNRVIARWKHQACEFDLAFGQTEDPLPDLGAYTCKGIKP